MEQDIIGLALTIARQELTIRQLQAALQESRQAEETPDDQRGTREQDD